MKDEIERLVEDLAIEVVPVTAASARHAAAAYLLWGKGFHAAGLNFGDCFAYDIAIAKKCPLLFVGDDFGKTDVRPAI